MIGNTLSIIILTREEMRNPFNRLALALACFDNLFIVLVIFDYTFARGRDNECDNIKLNKLLSKVFSWPFHQESQLYAYIFPKLIYPLNNVFLCCSIFTTICIALERWSHNLIIYQDIYLLQIQCSVQSLQVQI